MSKPNQQGRKEIIDKVSGMLQVLCTNVEYNLTNHTPPTEQELIRFCNKSAGEIVQVVLDYERAKALANLLPFTAEHMKVSKESYDAGYQQGYKDGWDQGWNDAIEPSLSTAE